MDKKKSFRQKTKNPRKKDDNNDNTNFVLHTTQCAVQIHTLHTQTVHNIYLYFFLVYKKILYLQVNFLPKKIYGIFYF